MTSKARYTDRETAQIKRLEVGIQYRRDQANDLAADLKRLKDKVRIRTIREDAREGGS